ncbi:hypothetical protein KAR91_40615 [Candidatus Pacearchaeota archaeon]|nr:hypothetical protein [Candidatus Pacearchaeota archaeon]
MECDNCNEKMTIREARNKICFHCMVYDFLDPDCMMEEIENLKTKIKALKKLLESKL